MGSPPPGPEPKADDSQSTVCQPALCLSPLVRLFTKEKAQQSGGYLQIPHIGLGLQ